MNDVKPLSAMVAQGWEIVGFSNGVDAASGAHSHNVLLRRQKQHKILQIRARWMGKGLVTKEIDV